MTAIDALIVARDCSNVTVLFSHIHDFDSLTAQLEPLEVSQAIGNDVHLILLRSALQLLALLNKLFSRFDFLTEEHKVYKGEFGSAKVHASSRVSRSGDDR